MAFTMTEASSILKLDYLPVVRETLPKKTPLYTRIQKGTEDVVGSAAQFVVRTGRNQGVGARPNGAALPAAGSSKYKKVSVETANVYGRMEVAGKVFKAAASNRGAFVNAVDAELKGVVESLQFDLNRMLYNTSTGTLAVLAAAATVNTFTVTSSNASTKTRWLTVGMLVDVYDTTGVTAKALARTITVVDKAAGTFTVDGAAFTTVAGDIVIRAGAINAEITGLRQVFTENTLLYDIDRNLAANKFFNPQRLHNSGANRAISETMLQTGVDLSDTEAGGTISLMISTHGVRRSYQDLLAALKRFTEPKKLSGGWTALDYNGIDWVADADMKANTLYMLDESTVKIHTMIADAFDWGEEDGQVMRQVAGYDSYEAFMVGYLNLGVDAPAKSVVIEDITEK